MRLKSKKRVFLSGNGVWRKRGDRNIKRVGLYLRQYNSRSILCPERYTRAQNEIDGGEEKRNGTIRVETRHPSSIQLSTFSNDTCWLCIYKYTISSRMRLLRGPVHGMMMMMQMIYGAHTPLYDDRLGNVRLTRSFSPFFLFLI